MHRVGRRCPGCSEFAANISWGARPHSPNAQSIPGMAAGVTERLWEIGDIVDVLEAWQRVRVGHVLYQPAETLTRARMLRVRARLPYPIGPPDVFAMAVSLVARAA